MYVPIYFLFSPKDTIADYKQHLWERNGKLIGLKFYQKSIAFFKKMYKRPLFIMTSDDKESAIKSVSKPLKEKDLLFVGKIDDGLEGLLTKEESVGIDFGTLTQCDHLIISQGTFGLWAALLSKAENNTHIMADLLVSEEVLSVKQANLSQIRFIDDN